MVATQRNWSKKWQHVCHYNPHSLFFFKLFYLLYFGQNSFTPGAFKNWGGGVYLKRIHNKITQPMCYQYCFYTTDMRPNPSPSPSSVRLIYFVIFNFSFLTKVSCWRMYANCVWVCLCLYMADCKYKVRVRQWCWWHLLSTDKHHIKLFFLSKKPGVVQNIAFHITPTATY